LLIAVRRVLPIVEQNQSKTIEEFRILSRKPRRKNRLAGVEMPPRKKARTEIIRPRSASTMIAVLILRT
jgi:hypothetical protein